jgi:hypothetical protein
VSEPRTIEERKIFESRRMMIIRYIMDHPNCTKADVIRYMKGRSAVRTTHAILMSLKDEGKINQYEKHTQTHLLTVNEDNDFIKLYKRMEELYEFTNEARKYIHPMSLRRFYKYYKTKPPLKYEGIDGFENSFRQLFNIITQVLYYRIGMTSRGQETHAADWRLLDTEIKYLFFNLAFYGWDKNTTKEVIDLSAQNIKQFFQTLNKEKNKLVKMMEREQIDRINDYIEFGDKLIEIIDKFKKDFSYAYKPT